MSNEMEDQLIGAKAQLFFYLGVYIPLTNRVRGPYCKLRTKFFPVDLWPKREARGP